MTREDGTPKVRKPPGKRQKLSLFPLSVEDALRGVIETGPPTESLRKKRDKRRRQKKVEKKRGKEAAR